MTDVLEVSSNWLQQKRKEHLSRPVSYHRGTAAVQVNAALGRASFEQLSEFDFVLKDEYRCYLILADDLVLPGVGKTTPNRGDQIKEVRESTEYTYEVMSPSNAVPPFEYVDHKYERMLKVHTKLVPTT